MEADRRIGEGRHQPQPPAAVRTGEDVEGEGPVQELSPGDVAGADVARRGRRAARYGGGQCEAVLVRPSLPRS